MNYLPMTDFCAKYGIKQYTLCRRISEYQTGYVGGRKKPQIAENDYNIALARIHSAIKAHRPQKANLLVDDYIKKYNIDPARLKARWKSIQKVKIDDQIYIADIRNNLRHFGLI